MGCDIHLYKEKQVNGVWLSADAEGVEYSQDRNYELFGFLSKGVRRRNEFAFAPRGVPFDICAETAQEVEDWGTDGHSHSYLYLHELKDSFIFLKTNDPNSYVLPCLEEIIDCFDGIEGENHRVVFFFDN